MDQQHLIETNPNKMSGTPVFHGNWLPIVDTLRNLS